METKTKLQPLLILILGFSFVRADADVNCSDTIQNGHLDFGEIKCNDGYDLHGDKNVTCYSNGTWSSNSTCIIKDCGNIYSLKHGQVNFTERGTVFNHTVPVICDLGHEPQGDPYITCRDDGTWSNDTSCKIIVSTGQANLTIPHEKNNANSITIPIATGVILAVGIIVCVVIFLYFKRWRKTRFTKTVEQSHLEQLEMEFKVWSKFRPAVVKLSELPSYIDDLHKDKNKMFSDGFRLLKDQSPSHATTAAETPACRPKTRYTNILPFDHSRVKLSPIEEVEGSDFINANYIPGYKSPKEYIATQTPLPETKTDFWRMIWEQNVDIIVMLTKRFETRKNSLPKNYSVERHGTASTFDQYWPDKVQVPVYYGDLEVNTLSESILSSYITIVMEVKLGTETRTVTQIHFLSWPDHGCPRRTWPFINFVIMVRQYRPQQIVVHCSTGVSRTGTFIAVDRLLQHVTKHEDVDIYSVILDMRNYRCNMIKTEEQFIFIYECIRHFITTEEDVEDEKDETRPSFHTNIAFQGEGTC